MILNVPNGLTLARVALIPVFLFFLYADGPLFGLIALGIFALAALTDAVDGYLARLRAETTPFGKFMDPIADKVLVMAALVSFVGFGNLPAIPVIVILGREFLVTGLRILAVGQGLQIGASLWGKAKTVSHIALVLMILVERHFGLGMLAQPLKMAFLYLAVLLALVSGGEYFWRARSVFSER